MSSQAPAYQMYAGDWLKSRSVRLMVDYQRGWYIQLLNEAWDGTPQCMLPKDRATLQVLAGVSEVSRAQPGFNDRWTAVERMFKENGEYVYNERQLEELSKQEMRRKQARKAGLESAKKRAKARRELKRIKREQLAKSNGRSTDVQRKGNGTPTEKQHSSLLSSPSTLPPSEVTPIVPKGTRRKAGFKGWTVEDLRQDVAKSNHDNLLTTAECADFVEYWTEQTNTGRYKFSLNRTWDTRRRMQTALCMIYEKQRVDHPAPKFAINTPDWVRADAPDKETYDRDQADAKRWREEAQT